VTGILRFALQPDSPIPLYLQIMEQIRHHIASGALKADDELPSVRTMATRHLINPNTVARAYRELECEGLVSKRRGEGTYVSARATELKQAHRLRLVADLLDKALVAAKEFGLSPERMQNLFDQRLQRQHALTKLER
jgi:GntR family transcriptional regulator